MRIKVFAEIENITALQTHFETREKITILECLPHWYIIKLSIYLWYIYHISGMVHISGKQMVPLTIPAKLETFKSTKNIFNWKWCRILEDACSCEHSGIVKLERIAFHTSFNSCTCLPMWTVMPANVDRKDFVEVSKLHGLSFLFFFANEPKRSKETNSGKLAQNDTEIFKVFTTFEICLLSFSAQINIQFAKKNCKRNALILYKSPGYLWDIFRPGLKLTKTFFPYEIRTYNLCSFM